MEPFDLLISQTPLPCDAGAARAACEAGPGAPLWHAVGGWRLPALPCVPAAVAADPHQVNFMCERFKEAWDVYLRALHPAAAALADEQVAAAFALQADARPRRTYGARVELLFLFRAAAPAADAARQALTEFMLAARALFPAGAPLAPVPVPEPLTESELRHALWLDRPGPALHLVEIGKFVEGEGRALPGGAPRELIIPHPFFPPAGVRSPWPYLFNVLERAERPLALRVALAPALLTGPELETVEVAQGEFVKAVRDAEQQDELIDHAAAREVFDRGAAPLGVNTLLSARRVGAARWLGPPDLLLARRGSHAFRRLYESAGCLFTLGLTLAAADAPVPAALTRAVTAAVYNLPEREAKDGAGWRPAQAAAPADGARAQAALAFQWLGQPPDGAPRLRRTRHSLATAAETLGLFHVPLMHGPTTGTATANLPFTLPAELLESIERARAAAPPRVTLGYLCYGDKCFDPATVGPDKALPFTVSLAELTMPKLGSGAPGGGKSNYLEHLLIELWARHGVPACVIDPGTGQEFRYLLGHEALAGKLVLFTAGDESVCPLRFNPFALPPSGPDQTVTVAAHATRLLAAFKNAFDCWDPLPAIYQNALRRAYEQRGWRMNDTLETGRARGLRAPRLADFAAAVEEELTVNVLPDYGADSEAAGVLLGAAKIRVNNILTHYGHVLDVEDDDPAFFQRLLDTPCVIELGALGSEEVISLVMSFLVVQLRGHTEYASRHGGRKGLRLLCIDEAHVLLSNENQTGGPFQGNVRARTAEDMNRLLSEFRKFGTGVVLLDQRPASLIGGALDNTYLNVMFRTADRKSLQHLADALNLSPAQQQYARTKLGGGQAVVLDRHSGQPVLIKCPNVIDGLREAQLPFAALVERVNANAAAAGLRPPPRAPSAGPGAAPTAAGGVIRPRARLGAGGRRREDE
jgi:hypothetical protein